MSDSFLTLTNMKLFEQFLKSLSQTKTEKYSSRLHSKITQEFPSYDETFHLKAACLSGLMARVAFADMNISEDEKDLISRSLKQWFEMEQKDADSLATICLEEISELAGIENHLYCLPLRESLQEGERFKILQVLFSIAASDQNVENTENEEIRQISKGLLLEHHHFIAARGHVLEHLNSLKK